VPASLPEYGNWVASKHPIITNKCHAFRYRLRDEDAVEGVAVEGGECADFEGVGDVYGEFLKGVDG